MNYQRPTEEQTDTDQQENNKNMEVNIKTKYSVGDICYTMYNDHIVKVEITRISFQGHRDKDSGNEFRLGHSIRNKEYDIKINAVPEEALFATKEELINHLLNEAE